ncbi:MAG: hypothetical protein Q9222_002997 [Ikaeria aurantiellina]
MASQDHVQEVQNNGFAQPSVNRAVRFAPERDSNEALISPNIDSTETTLEYIRDFCSEIRVPKLSQGAIGILVDEKNDRHQHEIYRVGSISGPNTSSRSLKELLMIPQQHSPDDSLSRRDRLHIAVILASSILQLDGTSWLKSMWSTDDIFFHQNSGTRRAVDVSHPYLSWQRCCNAQIPSLEQLRLSSYMIRNEVILALGLALIELCFGRTLEEMRKPEDIDIKEATTRCKTAHRLHNRVYREMGVPYGEVVRRCLYQLFDVRELSLDLEEVQQKVLDDIVTPLVNDLRGFDGHR